jgi:hypothetical protein
MSGMLLPALLLARPLVAMHFYARAYVEPPIESSSDCKDPNARPASRAEKSSPFERDQFLNEELPKELEFFATKTSPRLILIE